MSQSNATPSTETLKALETAPNIYLILSPELTILTASDLALKATETTREKIVGKHIFEAFPDSPELFSADGLQNINASLQEVLRTKKPHYVQTIRYDVPDLNHPGKFIQRYWEPSNTPVLNETGEIQYIIQQSNDVTQKVLTEKALAESFAQLHKLNGELDKANREIAATNQELVKSVDALKYSNQNLDAQVQQRTAELATSNEELAATNEELAVSNEELSVLNEELTATNEELLALEDNLLVLNNDLTESEQRFRSLMKDAPVPIGVLRGVHLILEMANEAMLKMLGKTAAIIGQPLLNGIPELRGQLLVYILCRVYNTGKPFRAKAVHVTLNRNGKEESCYFNLNYKPLYEGGKITGILGAALEVSEQVRAHQAVVESEERFRTMAESAHILISVGDETGKATYFNNAWTDLTGRPTEGLLKLGWLDLIHIEDKEHYLSSYSSAFKAKAPYTIEFRILNSQGEYSWLLAKGSPRFRPDSSFAGYTSTSVDITEQKQDEQRKNDFIGIVSHELKTPITTLSAYLQVLQGKAGATQDKFMLGALDKSFAQVKKMTTMINGFLNVSRLESGKIYINKQHFDMAALVEETEAETMTISPSHHFVFARVEPIFVYADRDKIGQVINNFISNAVKYSAPESTIQVACTTVDGQIEVSVKDEGMGISPKDIQKLFTRYYRVEGTHMRTISGFGIGLYLCAEIIQRHGGKIWVESEAGKGSTFYFSLPLEN